MAKKTQQPPADDAAAVNETPAADAAAAEAPAEPTKVTVEARRAGAWGEVGTVLGEVTLAPGVSLNFLVDAVRGGIAGEKHEAT